MLNSYLKLFYIHGLFFAYSRHKIIPLLCVDILLIMCHLNWMLLHYNSYCFTHFIFKLIYSHLNLVNSIQILILLMPLKLNLLYSNLLVECKNHLLNLELQELLLVIIKLVNQLNLNYFIIPIFLDSLYFL